VKLADTSTEYIRAARASSVRSMEAIAKQASFLRTREKVRLAQILLNSAIDDGIDYDEFQSAQAAERYVKKARNALRGLPLA
jgi:hypothetical protein